MGHPRPLFCLFLSFQTNITIFTTNKCEKWPFSTLRCWNSNPRPSYHESPPITTRPEANVPLCCRLISILSFFRSLSLGIRQARRGKLLSERRLSFVRYFQVKMSDTHSVTSKKFPSVYKSCPKTILLEKLKILTPLQKLPKNVWHLGKLIVAPGFEWFPKVQ